MPNEPINPHIFELREEPRASRGNSQSQNEWIRFKLIKFTGGRCKHHTNNRGQDQTLVTGTARQQLHLQHHGASQNILRELMKCGKKLCRGGPPAMILMNGGGSSLWLKAYSCFYLSIFYQDMGSYPCFARNHHWFQGQYSAPGAD